MNKAIFIDRDGVINVDKGHVYKSEDFEFIEEIFEICRKYINMGFIILVITNQAGIAKRIFTESDFLKLTDWMVEQFRNNGVKISKVYHCPHHPDITGPCECRKPNPGMILQAIDEFDLDISRSVLIGDKDTDLEAGRRAGIPEANLHLYKSEN
jgi:D-glycero-D-manno-heptose 1,7-bisphosphate phosphatase